MHAILSFIFLFAFWILLSGKFDLFHLSLGGVSCLLVVWLSSDLLFYEKDKRVARRIGEAGRFILYTFWLLGEIFRANLHVIGLALSLKPKERIDPHLVTFKTCLQSPFARFVLANSITLTPGTVTIRIDKNVFYVHAITAKAAGDLSETTPVSEMEKKVAWVFQKGGVSAKG